MATPQQRKTLSEARRIAEYSLGWAIERLVDDPAKRLQLRVMFVAVMLANKQQTVLSVLVADHPEYQEAIAEAAAVIDHDLQSDPDHFMHAIIDAQTKAAETTDQEGSAGGG